MTKKHFLYFLMVLVKLYKADHCFCKRNQCTSRDTENSRSCRWSRFVLEYSDQNKSDSERCSSRNQWCDCKFVKCFKDGEFRITADGTKLISTKSGQVQVLGIRGDQFEVGASASLPKSNKNIH